MSGHQTCWAKINAPVDEGVRPLVEALSLFPKVQTFESCEGYGDEYQRVWFHYGVNYREWWPICEFCFNHLGPALTKEFGDLVLLQVHMHPNLGYPYGFIQVAKPPVAPRVVYFLKKLSKAR